MLNGGPKKRREDTQKNPSSSSSDRGRVSIHYYPPLRVPPRSSLTARRKNNLGNKAHLSQRASSKHFRVGIVTVGAGENTFGFLSAPHHRDDRGRGGSCVPVETASGVSRGPLGKLSCDPRAVFFFHPISARFTLHGYAEVSERNE